jgi:hypothetical protein
MPGGGRMPETEPERGQDLLASLRRLSDADLVARVKSLVARERRAALMRTRRAGLRRTSARALLLRLLQDALSPPEHGPTTASRSRVRPPLPCHLEMLASAVPRRWAGPYLA